MYFERGLELVELLGRQSSFKCSEFKRGIEEFRRTDCKPQAKRKWENVALETKDLNLAFFCSISNV